MFSIITVADAIQQFHMPHYAKATLTENPDKPLLLHRGDLHIDGHLTLDYEIDRPVMEERLGDVSPSALRWQDWKMATVSNDAQGLMIDGNLTLTGSVINTEDDYGPTLLVTGNFTARSLVFGGSAITVLGNATLREALYGSLGGHGLLNADCHAPLYITAAERRFYINKQGREPWEQGVTAWVEWEDEVASHKGNPRYSDERPVPTAMRGLIAPQIQSWEAIYRALCAGRPILAE